VSPGVRDVPDESRDPGPRGSRDQWEGLLIAAAAPVAIALVLLPFRSDLRTDNVSLVLVLAVMIGAMAGERLGGAIAAVLAAVSFDFLFTRPYYSFTISSGDDLQTFLLLLAVGLVAGELVVRSRRSYAVARRSRREAEQLRHMAELAAGGESPGRLVLVVQNELTRILDLKSCRFERPPFQTSLPQLRHRGVRLAAGDVDQSGLHSQLELPVRANGRVLGRFVLTMPVEGSGIGLPAADRALAVALADQLGVALAGPPSPPPSPE
jgi:K+-sensing histidine kinase KdpD